MSFIWCVLVHFWIHEISKKWHLTLLQFMIIYWSAFCIKSVHIAYKTHWQPSEHHLWPCGMLYMVNKNMEQDHPKWWGIRCPVCQLPTFLIQIDEPIPKAGFGDISHHRGGHYMSKTWFPYMTKLQCFTSLGYNTSPVECFCSSREQGNTSRHYFHWYIPM